MSLPKEIEITLKTANEKLLSAKILLDAGHYGDAASSSHGQAIGAFNREFVKTEIFPKHFGRWLIKMQSDREAGDYRTRSPIGEQIAAEDTKMAEEVFDSCRQYLESAYHLNRNATSNNQ